MRGIVLVALIGCGIVSDARVFRTDATDESHDQGPFMVLQRDDRAWTLDAAGTIRSLGRLDAQDIDPRGRIVGLRGDQIWYTAPGNNGSISFYRRDAVVVVDAATGTSHLLAEAAPNETFDGPARWSPDGRTIALWVVSYPAPLAEAHPGANAGEPALCLISSEDGARRCFPHAGRTVSLDWSADGSRLLVAGLGGPVSVLDVSTGVAASIIDASGGAEAASLLADHDVGHVIALEEAAWSHAGRYGAVPASVVPGGRVVMVYSAAGEALAVGAASNDAAPFAWSPTDDLLAYAAWNSSTSAHWLAEIHLWDPSSGDVRVETLSDPGGTDIISMVWSPDDKDLALNTDGGSWLLEEGTSGAWTLGRIDVPGAVVAWG